MPDGQTMLTTVIKITGLATVAAGVLAMFLSVDDVSFTKAMCSFIIGMSLLIYGRVVED